VRHLLRLLLREGEREELPLTTQRRASRRGKPRTSRRVWVNTRINQSLTVDTIEIVDLLAGAAEFMVFDCTVLAMMVTWLTYTSDLAATLGTREIAVAIHKGDELLDSADAISPRTSSIGPPWLWNKCSSARFAATAQSQTTDLISGENAVRIKAMRRFTENNQTLWLTVENASEAGDTNLNLSGMVRTLLLVP